VYWFAADRIRAAAGKPTAFVRMWLLPGVVYGTVVVAVLAWALLVLQPWIPLPTAVRDPLTCNCIAGRFLDLPLHPGGRNELVEAGWALFAGHPLFGAGLGSYLGLADHAYPHNIPLEVAGEMGLVGVLVLLVPLLVGWVRLAVAGVRSASPAAASAVMILLVYVVVANLSGDLGSERGLWVFGLIVLKLGWSAGSAEVAA
jgi:O-antigen ligase